MCWFVGFQIVMHRQLQPTMRLCLLGSYSCVPGGQLGIFKGQTISASISAAVRASSTLRPMGCLLMWKPLASPRKSPTSARGIDSVTGVLLHQGYFRPSSKEILSHQGWEKQIKSEGFDSCDQPSNLTQPLIWWMTWKIIGCLFYTTSSFVHHFKPLELQSRNT